jgi:hypothetical protein
MGYRCSCGDGFWTNSDVNLTGLKECEDDKSNKGE